MTNKTISILDKEEYSNPEKKTNVTKLQFIVKTPDLYRLPSDVTEECFEFLSQFGGQLISWEPTETFIGIELHTIGKAKANPKDDYDEEFGKKLAEMRAKKNMSRIGERIYKGIQKIISDWVFYNFDMKLIDARISLNDKIEDVNDKIDNLIKEKYEN